MKRFFTFALLSLVLYSIDSFGRDIYVSTTGSDTRGNGTISNPFRTIDKARITAREYTGSQNVNVHVRGGTYYLSTTLSFESNDSGNKSYKVRYTAYNNEKVILSGGRKITSGWIQDKNGIWKVNLSKINSNNIAFRQLWVDGIKAQRAKCGIKVTKAPASAKDRIIEFYTKDTDGQLITSVSHKEDIEIWTYVRWMANIVKVDNIYDNKITTNIKTPYTRFDDNSKNPQLIFDVQNAYAFIDKPGEWFYDKHDGYLYYYPVENKNPNTSEIIFPILEKLISATNLSYVEFSGLTFSHATWLLPNDDGYISGQGSIYVEYDTDQQKLVHQRESLANIDFIGCSFILIQNNYFTHLGAEAICFQNASKNNTINNNSFTDIAGTAIRIGNGQGYNTSDIQFATQYNVISNNRISYAANEFKSHCGIWLGFVCSNKVINNELYSLPYSGISIGYPYKKESKYPLLGANTIEDNEISKVMISLRDGGAIYNHAPSEAGPSYIKHNKICDIRAHYTNVANIYLDQGTSNFKVTDNYGEAPIDNSGNVKEDQSIFTNFADRNEVNNTYLHNNFPGCSNHWINVDDYAPDYHTAADGMGDLGVRFIDVDHDGLKDLVYYRWISKDNVQKGVYLNKCGKWGAKEPENSPYNLPYHLYVDGIGDMGVQIVDFDNDGFDDIIYSRYKYSDQCRAYRNTGYGWQYISAYNPPIPMFSDYYDIGDLGVRFFDVNNDKYPDLIYSRWLTQGNQHRRVYLNTKTGWKRTYDPQYFIPNEIMFSADHNGDLGVQIVDLNNDGKKDLLFWRWGFEKGAYLQKTSGNGWISSSQYTPKYPIFLNGKGLLGVKLIDVNHDNYIDMVVHRKVTSSRTEKLAWLNTGGTWVSTISDYAPVMPTCIDYEGGDQGVLTVDLNGDGYEDIVQAYWKKPVNESSSYLFSHAYLNNSSISCANKNNTENVTNGINESEIELLDELAINTDECFSINCLPNPFHETAKLVLDVYYREQININVYSVSGKLIQSLTNETFETGRSYLELKTDINPGVYIITAKSNNYFQTLKLIKK